MILIPSIDVEGAIAVKRVQGRRGTGIKIGDPVKLAIKFWENGAKVIHVVDLDGAEQGKPRNLWLVKKIKEETNVVIQFGGGVRTTSDVEEAYHAGVDVLVLGTAWVKNPHIIDYAKRIGLKVILALDARGDKIAIHGWRSVTDISLEEAVKITEAYSPFGYLVTCIDAEGLLIGACLRYASRVRAATNRIVEYAGGVRDYLDVITLKSIGVDGVVLGMALYSGSINLTGYWNTDFGWYKWLEKHV